MKHSLFNIDTKRLDNGEYILSWYQKIMTLTPRPAWRRFLRLPAKSVETWHPFTFRVLVKEDGFEIGPGDGTYYNGQLQRRDIPSGYVETVKNGTT